MLELTPKKMLSTNGPPREWVVVCATREERKRGRNRLRGLVNHSSAHARRTRGAAGCGFWR